MSPQPFKLSKIEQVINENYAGIHVLQIERNECDRVFSVISNERPLIFKFHDPLIVPNLAKLDKVYQICAEGKLTPELILNRQGRALFQANGWIVSLQIKKNRENASIEPDRFGLRVSKLHHLLKLLNFDEMANHLQRSVTNIAYLADRYGYKTMLPMLKRVEKLRLNKAHQLIHGDLHQGNVISSEGEYFFIDLDSANVFVPFSDIGFSAFRIFGFESDPIEAFMNAYNHHRAGEPVTRNLIFDFAVYNILQRILFIRSELERGNDCHLWDLSNQENYLAQVFEKWMI